MKSSIFLCGEALIDFITQDGITYKSATGGSPFNAAKAAAMAGAKTYFCGSVSKDLFGDRILDDLVQYGVNCTHVQMSNLPTVLGFIQVSEESNPIYAFYDRESCMQNMDPYLPEDILQPSDILVIGSISLINSPGADRIEQFALNHAQTASLALDPNVRPAMIKGQKGWWKRIQNLMDNAAIIKISLEDLEYFAPDLSCDSFAEKSLSKGTKLVITTDGENGSKAWSHSGHANVIGLNVDGGDTVGAGDTLMGYSLAWLIEKECSQRHELALLNDSELHSMLKYANTAAAMNCETVGCNPPKWKEVELRIKNLTICDSHKPKSA